MAVGFDGTSDVYTYTSNVGITDPPFSFFCRFKPNNITATHALVGLYATSNQHSHALYFNGAAANDPMMAQSNQAGVVTGSAITGATSISASNWYDAFATFTSTSRRDVYLTEAVTANNTTNVAVSSLDSVRVGNVGAVYMDGDLAEAGVWNVLLSEDDRNSLRSGFPPWRVRLSALKWYAKMDIIMRERVTDGLGGGGLSGGGLPIGNGPRHIGW